MGYRTDMVQAVTDPARVIRDALKHQTVVPRRTQTQIAAQVGLTWRQWTQRMRGDVTWRLDELERVAQALDIELYELMREQG